MSSIFKQIIDGEIPCYKIAEDEFHLAFLDINPLKEGHTLVIPKEEIDYIFDLGDAKLERLVVFAKIVARAIKQAVPCTKVGVSVVGLEVPHAHIHLIPINSVSEMNFSADKIIVASEKMKQICEEIASNIEV